MKIHSKITLQQIKLPELLQYFDSPESGGIVVFLGTVRNNNHGKEVDHLFYESHEQLAQKQMTEILDKYCSKFELQHALAIHRVGKVKVGEIAVVVVTWAGHRSESYEANEGIIHTIKREVAIWKKEVFSDGTYAWGNNCRC